MNEYQDQCEWFELRAFCVLHNHWETVKDYDTREDALKAFEEISARDPEGRYAVRRQWGIDPNVTPVQDIDETRLHDTPTTDAYMRKVWGES